MVGQIVRLCALADEEALLLIILDDLRRPNLRVVRVEPDIAKRTSLAQEVPALIKFDLNLPEPLTIGLGKFPLLIQSLFFFDEALNISEDGLIPKLTLHESLLSRGHGRNGTILCYAPLKLRSTAAGQHHDVPSDQEHREVLNFQVHALVGGPTALSAMLIRPAAVRFCCETA